jgi:antitoxin FitA
MAKVIQVRDVPDELHAELRKRAHLAGTSLSQYALEVLERSVRQAGVREVIERAQARPPYGFTMDDVLEALDEERAAHDRR